MHILQALFLFATWSSIFPIGKLLLEVSPPLFLTAFRMCFAGVLLVGYLIFFKKSSLKFGWKGWLSIGLLAFFSIYLTNILEFWSLKRLSSAKTCFIYSLSPFFTALLSYFHFKEKMTPMKWLGMSIGFLGFIPVFMLNTGSEGLLGAFAGFSWPEIAMVFASFFGVYGWILLRMCVKDRQMDFFAVNGLSMLLGGLMALTHSFFSDVWAPTPVSPGHFPQFFQGVVAASFISNILCYNLYGYLSKKFTATLLSFFGLLSPIFASITGWFVLGEVPSLAIIGSTFIVLFGLWIVYREELRQGYIITSEKKEPTET